MFLGVVQHQIDGIGGGSELVGGRARKPLVQDGEDFLSINHGIAFARTGGRSYEEGPVT